MERIEVAEVLKPQGIKGELKLRSMTESGQVFEEGEKLILGNTELTVSTSRQNGEFVFIKFAEISSVQEAEGYRGAFVYADKEKLAKTLEEGEYFLSDLIGKMAEFESGESLGEITDIQNFGSADVFYVLKKNGKEVLFSNVDGVIIKVDDDKVIINKKRFEEVSV